MLRDGWNLGDVNDMFVLIFVNKDKEIEFLSKNFRRSKSMNFTQSYQ